VCTGVPVIHGGFRGSWWRNGGAGRSESRPPGMVPEITGEECPCWLANRRECQRESPSQRLVGHNYRLGHPTGILSRPVWKHFFDQGREMLCQEVWSQNVELEGGRAPSEAAILGGAGCAEHPEVVPRTTRRNDGSRGICASRVDRAFVQRVSFELREVRRVDPGKVQAERSGTPG